MNSLPDREIVKIAWAAMGNKGFLIDEALKATSTVEWARIERMNRVIEIVRPFFDEYDWDKKAYPLITMVRSTHRTLSRELDWDYEAKA